MATSTPEEEIFFKGAKEVRIRKWVRQTKINTPNKLVNTAVFTKVIRVALYSASERLTLTHQSASPISTGARKRFTLPLSKLSVTTLNDFPSAFMLSRVLYASSGNVSFTGFATASASIE